MALTTRSAEPMRRAIRRLARTQLRSAADTLNDRRVPLSERIHELRTSIKKVRALIALTQETVGAPARRANGRLRSIAAVTSELRDAEMVLHTLDGVTAHLPQRPANGHSLAAEMRPSLAAARDQLATRLREAERSFDAPRRLPSLIAELTEEAHKVRSWIPADRGRWRTTREPASPAPLKAGPQTPGEQREPVQHDDRRAAAAALARGYRRARRAMSVAYENPEGETFHDWRKAVKAHRYQLQFLRGTWPAEAAARLSDLERLSELLGDEHDLTVLEETIKASASLFSSSSGQGKAADQLLTMMRQRREALRAEARPIGERLFAERARVLKQRLLRLLPPGPGTGSGKRAPNPAAQATQAEDASERARPRDVPSHRTLSSAPGGGETRVGRPTPL